MRFFLILFIVILPGCQSIQTGKNLKSSTIKHIKSLGLLANDEQIIQYYSNYTEKSAGNFFTNKRIAHYWLDSYDKADNNIAFAFYEDIAAIDTVYKVPDTYAPYMRITRLDSSTFDVYVEGNREQIKSFFEGAIEVWQKDKKGKAP